MAQVFVTGGGGQLGSCLRDLAPEFTYLEKEDLDLSDIKAIKSFFEGKSADLIVHAAAYTQVDAAESNKEIAFRVNADATAELAKHCDNFVYVSTDYVYDGNAKSALTEESALSPANVYGASKLEGEKLAIQNNDKTWILRTSWLFSEYGHNFVKTMLRLGLEKDSLSIVNDQVGCPTYAGDLAEAILEITKNKIPFGHYNFCNTEQTTWFDFAKKIFELSNVQIELKPVTTNEYPTPAKRPAFSAMSTQKISQYIGSPRPWTEALKDCLERLQ